MLQQWTADGTKLIDQALANEPDPVKNAPSFDVKKASDKDLQTTLDLLKVYESARSYRTSLMFQSMRIAEMEGKTADRDSIKAPFQLKIRSRNCKHTRAK